jgi:hypothetical protein
MSVGFGRGRAHALPARRSLRTSKPWMARLLIERAAGVGERTRKDSASIAASLRCAKYQPPESEFNRTSAGH